jgi:hypothetical protein
MPSSTRDALAWRAIGMREITLQMVAERDAKRRERCRAC